MKKNVYQKSENFDFSVYEVITGDALYLINGGEEVENSNAGVAGAKPGDTIIRDDGTEVILTQGDIGWAQDQLNGDTSSYESDDSTPLVSDSPNYQPTSISGVSTNPTSDNQTEDNVDNNSFTTESVDIDHDNKKVTVDINDLKGLEEAYSSYYILSAQGYSFQLKDGESVVHTFTSDEPVKKYLESRTNVYNEVTGYSNQEIKSFKKMSTKEQLAFLKKEINSVEVGTKEAGIKAKYMRTQLKDSMNLKGLFYSNDGDEIFMNEDLRNFLNLNEKGKNEYTESEMKGSGWIRMVPYLGDNEHQHNQNGGRNKKYINVDGREAIFDAQGNYIGDGLDGATYNYGITGNLNFISTALGSSHGQYDMKPFYRQNQIDSKWWSMHVGNNYGFNSK